MTGPPAYERDPYLQELDTEVVSAGEDGGRPFAVLADTVCFPEGGGQPADRGRLGDVEVVDVQRTAGEIRHYLSAPAAVGAVRLRLDWDRRFDHMQQHTGQHLLTAVAQDRFGWPTTAFHLGESVCDVELDVAKLDERRLGTLETEVNAEILAGRRVTPSRVSAEEYAALAVRTRGLPAGHTGDVRLVEIAGLDLNTCGGTHLRSTAEIASLKLLGTEPMRGGTRVFFVAGGRVLRRLGAHEQRSAALRAVLGAPDDELAAVARAKLDELRALEKRLRAIDGELADHAAVALAARPGAFAEASYEGRDVAFLQRVARAACAADAAKVVLLTAPTADQTGFVLAAGDAATVDVQALGRDVAAALGARGGGSGRLFQGKAARGADREAAVSVVRAAVGAGAS
jgi:alanyl-tRNA synthetase